jgi:hypothetical protein
MRAVTELKAVARAGQPFVASIAVMLIVALEQINPSLAAGIPAETDIRNGTLVTVDIAENEFEIPRYYFLPWDVPTDQKRIEISIHALWPEMAPMREDNKDRYVSVRGHGPLLNILATDQRQITTLEFRLNAVTKLAAPYDNAPNEFGLQVIVPKDVNPHDIELRQEAYVDKGPDGFAGFITCNRDGSVPEPGCSQEFNYKHLLFQVDYGKYFLPQCGRSSRR